MTNQGTRIAETEREATVEALAEHLAMGRLSIEEFRERLGLAFAATTDGELAEVTVDLPRPARAPEPPLGMASPEERAERRARRVERRWTTFSSCNAALWALWGVGMVTTGGHWVGDLWPLWITAPWGAWLLAREPGLHRS